MSSSTEGGLPVALVTGAASGIGFGIAESLAGKGYKVLVSDINIEAAQEAVAKIEAAGGTAEPCKLDVTSQEDIEAAVEQAGKIDVLVNNAGMQYVAKLEEFPVDRWKLLVDILLTGPAMLTRAVLPAMKSSNYGRIVNVGSIHGLIASPYKTAYVAAKHGLIGFSKVVALEVADFDITINTLCPAYVKTPLVEKQIAAQAKENGITEEEVVNDIMLQPMPKKSFISIEEMCGAVDYLLSPVAKNMTAQSIVLDGAWTAR
ncbi:3-hydroxybutyrate dehydrogenase [Halioxenophilus aromaticivorans]|uniref:3-hydroxybutyrate dehydrogenase n=1 Tax=Halioxenophilus aromaticivorans TaxID=1306992 RepID=A0AAV3U0N3_9ALTE